jgi:kynureninase
MKVQVEVDDYTAKQIQHEVEYATGKKHDVKQVTELFVQNLIDRYCSLEQKYK